jgi:hypothetical protein
VASFTGTLLMLQRYHGGRIRLLSAVQMPMWLVSGAFFSPPASRLAAAAREALPSRRFSDAARRGE